MYEIIAMVTMLIDHIGAVFFPNEAWIRCIGRIAMPIYTYGIVQGHRYTRNYKKYLLRLVILAIISQPFYMKLFETTDLNMIFTLIICLILLKYHEKTSGILKYVIIAIVAIYVQLFKCTYGMYAIVLAFIYYYGKNIICYHAALEIVYLYLGIWRGQYYSIISSIFMVNVKNYRLHGKARYFYRIFYPLHLAVLFFIKTFIG